MKLSLPLSVVIHRKRKDDRKFILNINNYRNTHHQVLNAAKKLYVEEVMAALAEAGYRAGVRMKGPLEFRYTLFPRTIRLTDVANPCSVIDKFTCDALVHLKVIEDDNYHVIRRTVYQFGEVDKNNPRCELEVVPC